MQIVSVIQSAKERENGRMRVARRGREREESWQRLSDRTIKNSKLTREMLYEIVMIIFYSWGYAYEIS